MSRSADSEQNLGPIQGVLSDEALWAEPPGEIEPALLAAIAGSEITEPVRRRRVRRVWWPVYVGAAALVAAVALIFFFGPFSSSDPQPSAVFALSGSAGAGEAAVGAAEAGWWIRVSLPDLDPAPENAFYEGWVSDGDSLVSVGTFHMRDGDSAVLWSGVPMREYPELMITLQQVGDGPEPSSDVVATGHLSG